LHIFSITANTPTSAVALANGSAAGPESASSYEQASAEFSMKQLIMSDPIHEAVAKLESKHQKVCTMDVGNGDAAE